MDVIDRFDAEMDHDHGLARIEIRNARGELVEPPEGVTYSAAYQPVEDSDQDEFDPSGAHSCVFCAAPDWRWMVTIRPSEPGAEFAWAPHLVACNACQQLCRSGHFDELRERIVRETGADWMLEYLDDLLARITAFTPRR